MKVKYRFHFPGGDWQEWRESGQIAGSLGESKPVDLIQMDTEGVGVAVQVHTEGFGWLEPVGGMEIAGIEGHQIEAIRVGLTGDNAEECEITYRSHIQDYGWLNWTRDGQSSGSEGNSKRLEAFQAYLAKKGEVFFDTNQLEPYILPAITPAPIVEGESESSKRRRICDIALSYVGYVAGGNNYSIFGDRHNDPFGEWCSYFVRSVFEDAGLEECYPNSGYVPTVEEWFLSHPTAYFHRQGQGYRPQPGDAILFDYNHNNGCDHVGIVIGTDGYDVSTVEGNTGDPRQVKYKEAYYDFNSPDIYGYCVPDFS